jgi:hypothetical protein
VSIGRVGDQVGVEVAVGDLAGELCELTLVGAGVGAEGGERVVE